MSKVNGVSLKAHGHDSTQHIACAKQHPMIHASTRCKAPFKRRDFCYLECACDAAPRD